MTEASHKPLDVGDPIKVTRGANASRTGVVMERRQTRDGTKLVVADGLGVSFEVDATKAELVKPE